MEIQEYASLSDAQHDWENIEKTIFHYPFQSWWYQNLFAQHFSKDAPLFILGVVEDRKLLAIGAFEIVDNTVILLGTKDVSSDPSLEQDITDFGDLLYTPEGEKVAQKIWDLLHTYFMKKGFATCDLRYVRQTSPTYQALQSQSSVKIHQQETSPFLTLPESWDEYLQGLERKQRHELKRKINRLEKETAFHLCKDQTIEDDFENFVRLHKLSDTNKEKFMTKEMEAFFWDMITCKKDDWQIHFCSLFIDNKQVASVMTFMNDEQTLLYNSGFDPDYAYYSVGLLVKAFLLKKSIQQGKKVYDFLRGNERYKYDLGAKDMPLFQLTIPS